MKVTRVFGRVPDIDAAKQSTTPSGSRLSFNVDEVRKSRSLPLVHSTVYDDRPRYSPSPGVRRATAAARAPLTPPPVVRRPTHAPSPPASSRLAWESLRRSPASRPTESDPSCPGTPPRAGQQPGVPGGPDLLLPETEYLYRRFVDESVTQETTTETDDVDEDSIHDILDGYHSEDNIDD